MERNTLNSSSQLEQSFSRLSIPPLNEYVITHICSFLPLCDIPRMRLISKLWSEAAVPILKRLGGLKLHLRLRVKNNGIMSESLDLQFMHEFITKFSVATVRLTLLSDSKCETNIHSNVDHQSLEEFLEDNLPNMRRIEVLNFCNLTPTFLPHFLSYCHTADELQLISDTPWGLVDPNTLSHLQLDHIRKLELSSSTAQSDAFLASILSCCRNTETLAITGVPKLLTSLVALLSSGFLPQLSHLRLESTQGLEEEAIFLASLASLPFLKEFDLGPTSFSRRGHLVSSFLQRQAPSLRRLSLENESWWAPSPRALLTWPSFSRLQSLTLIFTVFPYKIRFGSENTHRRICWELDFPVLERLVLQTPGQTPLKMKDWKAFFDSVMVFEPGSVQIVRSLRVLKLPDLDYRHLAKVGQWEVGEWRREQFERLRDIFVNVLEDWMTVIWRGGEVGMGLPSQRVKWRNERNVENELFLSSLKKVAGGPSLID